jgi:tRNA dimethylallyltransferase
VSLPPGLPVEALPVVAVVGPTATGKSDLAVVLAHALRAEAGPAEVINADASQLYRGMDIGTAKLSPEDRAGIPHHLLDVLEVTEEASLAAYQRDARAAIEEIRARGRVAILVGGSGLYVRAALDRLEIPPTDPSVRARLEREAGVAGAPAMHRRLAELDPAAAVAILPGNVRRVVRALEVIELTGRPFTATLPAREYLQPTVQLGLSAPRAVLDERIEARVEAMWRAGLVEETQALLPRGLREGRTASRALGYAQVLRMLDGDLDDVAARAETVTGTKRLARRQESWFRADPRVQWLPHGAPDLLERALRLTARAAGLAAGPGGVS